MPHAFTSQYIIKGNQDRSSSKAKNQEAGADGRDWMGAEEGGFTGLVLIDYIACFPFIEPRMAIPWMAQSTMSWALSHQTLIKEMPYRHTEA